MRLPVALHATHGDAVTIWPRMERRTSRTSPVPPHTSHRAGWVPGSQPIALAARARDREPDVDGGGGTERGLGEIEVHDRLGVGRARRTALPAAAEGVAAEERVEQVAEPERIAGRSTGRRPPGVARVPSSPKTS